MSDHYDRLENRTPASRELALMRDLRHLLGIAKARVPALRAQIKGVEPAKLLTRADLAKIPVIRRHDIAALQADGCPFGTLTATRLPLLKQVFVDCGLNAIEGQAKDWWGAGRALYAAGLRKGSLALNSFSYDLVPHGHMIASGAHAVGAPVIPAGNADLSTKIDIVKRFAPSFFCGTAAHLKALLDHAADRDEKLSSLKNALVTGPMTAGLRNEFSLRGLSVRQMALRPEIGVIAYECGPTDGMTINEGLIVEVVDPETALPVPSGMEGEIVVTRLNADYPLLRFATGDFTTALPHLSACGRTNLRIAVPRSVSLRDHGSCSKITAVHLDEIKKMHPSLGRMRLFVRRPRDHDVLHLKAEHGGGLDVIEKVSQTLHLVTQMRGTVEFVEPGSLAEDEFPIVDERPLN